MNQETFHVSDLLAIVFLFIYLKFRRIRFDSILRVPPKRTLVDGPIGVHYSWGWGRGGGEADYPGRGDYPGRAIFKGRLAGGDWPGGWEGIMRG